MSTESGSASSRLLFETRASFKSIGVSALFGVGGLLLLIIAAIGLFQGKVKVLQGLLVGGVGAIGVIVLVYELKHLKVVDRFYNDRAERVSGGKVIAVLRYADGIRFDYAVAERSGEAVLDFRGGRGTKFGIMSAKPGSRGNALNPSIETVEEFRDLLTEIVASEAMKTIESGKSFRVDKAWFLGPEGVQIDEHRIPWASLMVHPDDSSGDVVILHSGAAVAQRNMMDDNVLPALQVMDIMVNQQRIQRHEEAEKPGRGR